MVYMGSKRRIAKELVPIIQRYIDESHCEKYLEPFVGGANIIDKIDCKHKFGSDINKYLIALLEKARDDSANLPMEITEDEYKNVKMNKNNGMLVLLDFCVHSVQYFLVLMQETALEKGITQRKGIAI